VGEAVDVPDRTVGDWVVGAFRGVGHGVGDAVVRDHVGLILNAGCVGSVGEGLTAAAGLGGPGVSSPFKTLVRLMMNAAITNADTTAIHIKAHLKNAP